MALAVLDGNQSATTLSSVLTGGEHIVAHTVVSLGSTAISNITSAISGSVVSISNFPATQPISGVVTANVLGYDGANQEYLKLGLLSVGSTPEELRGAVEVVGINGNPLPISGVVTAAIQEPAVGINTFMAQGGGGSPAYAVGIGYNTAFNTEFLSVNDSGNNFPVAVNNSVTISSLPAISGTVTVGAMPNGALTTRFGTPTTANTSFATSAVTNASRKYLLIQNVTTQSNVITVGIGFTPTTTQGIQLTAGAGITFESSYIPTGAVYVLSSVTASNFTILEA